LLWFVVDLPELSFLQGGLKLSAPTGPVFKNERTDEARVEGDASRPDDSKLFIPGDCAALDSHRSRDSIFGFLRYKLIARCEPNIDR
jgi:hypothetical protein